MADSVPFEVQKCLASLDLERMMTLPDVILQGFVDGPDLPEPCDPLPPRLDRALEHRLLRPDQFTSFGMNRFGQFTIGIELKVPDRSIHACEVAC